MSTVNPATGATLVETVTDGSIKPEQRQQVFSFTGTAAALGQTNNIAAYGFAFQIFKFTKSAATENATVRLCLNGRGVAFLTISGLTAETIAVTSLVDGTNESAVMGWRKSDGTYITALGNGTYTLPVQ